MAKTRRQVTLQEQESGVPASPPQSLPTAVRPTRAKRTTARNNDNNDTTATPTEPPPSTRGSFSAIRGGRIGKAKKVGRSRTQLPATTQDDAPESSATDVDGHEGFHSLTQTEVAVQATPTTRGVSDNHDEMDNVEEELDVEPHGEIHSPTEVPAHPMQNQDVIAHPVQGSTTPEELHESATSLKFRDILKNTSPSPITSPGRFTLQAVAPIIPLDSSLEASVGLSTPTIGSPLSSSPLVKPSVEATTPITASRPSISPLDKPSVEASTPEIGSRLSTSPLVKPSVEASTRITGSPLSSSPLTKPVAQAQSPASQTPVYYMPSNPERSHSLMSIRMDYFQGSKDPKRPSNPAAFAVPSELVGPICRFIESRAAKGSDLSKLTTDHPAVHAIVHGNAKYMPQLPEWQSQQSPRHPGSTMKDAFIRKVQRKRGFRELEEETTTLMAENAKLKANAAGESIESPRKRTKMVPDPWTADGKLLLGRTKEIEVDEHGVALDPTEVPSLRWNDTEVRMRAKLEEARRIADVGESPYNAEEIPDTDGPAIGGLFAESQNQAQPEAVPETPRARRWGLSSLLPSARSVTRLIPFSSRLTTLTPQQQPSQPQQIPQTEPQVTANSSQPQREPDAVQPVTDASHHPQQPRSDAVNTVTNSTHRRQQPKSNQQRLLTKEQSEEEKRIKKLRARVRKEAQELEKQKKDFEDAKKDLAEQRKAAGVAQTPGQKRKRLPSPDVIPLPAGGGFGLVDEYFIVDSSSDEEDVAAQDTPTKERPMKKPRTSASDDFTIGSPFRARPYTGTLFAHPDAQRSRQEDNTFVKSNKPEADPVPDTTPPPGPTLVFKVPSPGDSDSDEEQEEEQERDIGPFQPSSSRSAPVPKSILRNSASSNSASSNSASSDTASSNSASNQSQPRPSANSAPPSKALAPPPRPNPSHATLPAIAAMAPPGALEKAREKALMYQPKQPSTLRESSRLSSTSTANSDPGDEADVEEYDPKNPAIVTSPTKVQVFGHSAPPAVSAFEQPVVNSTASGFQQLATQAVSNQLHEQQAAPETSDKQAETAYEDYAHADGRLIGNQQSVPTNAQTKVLNDAEQTKADSDSKIKADLDRWWKEHGDDYFLSEGYKEFEENLIAEEQELMDGPNGDPYHQPRNIISTALDRIGADGLADRGIQADIEDNWRPGDLERTESDPAKGMRVFFNRLVKNGAIERDMADRVIEIGVPPGLTQHFAGQDAMGPVAA